MSAKRHLKIAIAMVWWNGTRLASLLGFGPAQPGRLVVLYYHAVRAEDLCAFERQLDAIQTYADVVEADYVGPVNGRPKVAITFDDAFVSVIDNALPALETRKIPVTIFVPTACLGRPPSWAMEHGATDRNEVVATAEHVRAIAGRGVRIGAHSRTHPRLTTVAPKTAAEELAGSKADLEALLGGPIDTFAFPYGDYNDTVVETARSAGYRFVFTTEPRGIDPSDAGLVRSRVAVNPTDPPLEFWLKLRSAYEWMPMASQLKRRLSPKRT